MLPNHHLYEAAWGAAGLIWASCGAVLLRRRAGGAASWPRLLALVASALAATLAGARLHFILLAPDLLHTLGWHALVLPVAEGAGLRISGGLLTGLAVLTLAGPSATGGRLGRAAIADVLVPLAGLAVAVGRLGCFADGCCFGTRCTAPWCVRFAAGTPAWWNHVAQGLVTTSAPESASVHPLPLYLALAALLASATSLLSVPRRTLPDGVRALAFVAVLSLLRALVEPLRETAFGAGVPYERASSLAIGAGAGALLVSRLRTQRGAAPRGSGS